MSCRAQIVSRATLSGNNDFLWSIANAVPKEGFVSTNILRNTAEISPELGGNELSPWLIHQAIECPSQSN
jgi:hypothetical protein